MLKQKAFSNRLTVLGLGAFFLINPLFNIIDLLPDVIGYMLIYWSLSKFSDLDGRIESARKKALYLVFVSSFKIIMLIPVLKATSGSDRLLATFCFAIVELFLSVYAASDLFEGASYLFSRNESISALGLIPNARFLTFFFFIAKLGLSILPELYSLAETKMLTSISGDSFYYSLIKTKNIAVLLCMIIVMIIGVFWYTSVTKLIKATKSEPQLLERIAAKYNDDYEIHFETDRLETLKTGLFFAVFACFCMLDMTIEGIRFLPAALGVLVFAFVGRILKDQGSFKKTKKLFPAVFVIQVLSEAYRYAYADYNVTVMEQMKLLPVIIGAAVTLISAASLLYFLKNFLWELRASYQNVTGKEAPAFDLVKILFMVFLVLQSLRIAIPILYAPLSGICIVIGFAWVYFAFRCAYRMVSYYRSLIRFI